HGLLHHEVDLADRLAGAAAIKTPDLRVAVLRYTDEFDILRLHLDVSPLKDADHIRRVECAIASNDVGVRLIRKLRRFAVSGYDDLNHQDGVLQIVAIVVLDVPDE